MRPRVVAHGGFEYRYDGETLFARQPKATWGQVYAMPPELITLLHDLMEKPHLDSEGAPCT